MEPFYRLQTGRLSSPFLHLDYLLEGGLRIVRLLLNGDSTNLLAETPDYGWETPFGWYNLYGGHRLWQAPQHTLHTSIPEKQALQVEEIEGGVRLVQAADALTSVRKSIEIRLDTHRPVAEIRHKLTNDGQQPVELSAWGVTQVPLGGRIIMPQADAPIDTKSAGPNRHLVFWPYTVLPDPRLDIQNRYLLFEAHSAENEFKLGYFNPQGWIGYRWGGCFFLKRFFPQPGQIYPDIGSNVEIYCNHQFAEIETLSPLVTVDVGASIEHNEVWEIYTMDAARSLLALDAHLLD
jgi:hypothetical protein